MGISRVRGSLAPRAPGAPAAASLDNHLKNPVKIGLDKVNEPGYTPGFRRRSRLYGVSRSSGRALSCMMLDRCYNPRNKRYTDYGGRGIKVCDRWRRSFAAFISDMGFRPTSKHSLDRYPNNDGNYELANCRWATPQEQNDNQRRTILVNGKPLSYWARETGLSKHTLDMRLRAGWSVERALNPALAKRGPKSRVNGELPCQ